MLTADALQLNLRGVGPFEIVFLDPPFDGPPLADLCTLLADAEVLADNALVYMEAGRKSPVPDLPGGWTLFKERTAGQVRYSLVSVSRNSAQ